jgi:hypothetical protein
MEIKGKIKVLSATQEVSATFKKRELVVSTDEQYPQSILIEFIQDKCDILNSYKVGESVTVGINLRGREWTSPQGEVRYFNSLHGWKIARDVANIPVNDAKVVSPQPYKEGEEEDLPF